MTVPRKTRISETTYAFMIQGAAACRVPVLCDQPRLGRFTSPYRHCTPVTHHDVADALPANDDSISEIRPVAAAAHVGILGTHVQDTGWTGAEDRVRFIQDFVAHRGRCSKEDIRLSRQPMGSIGANSRYWAFGFAS
jgi:hypothetical protein